MKFLMRLYRAWQTANTTIVEPTVAQAIRTLSKHGYVALEDTDQHCPRCGAPNPVKVIHVR